MHPSLHKLQSYLDNQKGRKDALEDELRKLTHTQDTLSKYALKLDESQNIIRIVGQNIQMKVEYKIAEVVSLALASIFPDPYEVKLYFEQRNKGLEADIIFEREGIEINPYEECGGGVVDVACFALRIALWSLENPRKAPIMILDEPGKFISRDLQPKFSALIKEISKELGIQFIIVSHDSAIIDSADKIFKVKKIGKYSKVNIVDKCTEEIKNAQN